MSGAPESVPPLTSGPQVVLEPQRMAQAATPGPPPRDHRDGQATPGQAAYEAFVAFQSYDDVQFETWQEKDENGDTDVMGRADWEAAGRGVIASQQPQPAPDPAPTASWQHAIRALAGIRDSYDTGTMAHDTAHTALDRLAGLYPHGEQPAPELAGTPYLDALSDALTRKVTEAEAESGRLRELLDEIGVMAANAPEDGDSFGLLEEIAMRIGTFGVPQ